MAARSRNGRRTTEAPTGRVGERLRNRLRAAGAGALSDAELLAILVEDRGGGLRIARRVIDSVGPDGLAALRRTPAAELVDTLGEAGSARVAAALELGTRAATRPLERGHPLRGPADVFALLGPRLRHLRQEEFHVLSLDARHRLMCTALITRGTADTSLVHAREVFRGAIRESASGLILVHNHPSGDPRPSPEDRNVTRQLAKAGAVLGIPVLDHVIVGDGRFVSMSEEGELAT